MKANEFIHWVEETIKIMESMKCPKCGAEIWGYTDKSDNSEWLSCKKCGWSRNFIIEVGTL